MTAAINRILQRDGLLLLQDKTMCNVAALIAGETVRGSWWSHAKAHEIFACVERLTGSDDVLVTRLVARKVTFVHRRLWPAFLAVATSNAEWQTRGLSAAAKRLLGDAPVRATGAPARELQERLLVHAEEIHSESGRHEIELQAWDAWARGRRVKASTDEIGARAELEAAVAKIGGKTSALLWR